MLNNYKELYRFLLPDTLVTQTDVKLLQAIEEMIGTKLEEMEVDVEAIGEIHAQVGVTKREQVSNSF